MDTPQITAIAARRNVATPVPMGMMKNVCNLTARTSNSWEFVRWDSGITSSGPCPLNKVFIDIDGINGMCQCRDRNQLLFKGDDRCHRIYAKVIIACDKFVMYMSYTLIKLSTMFYIY